MPPAPPAPAGLGVAERTRADRVALVVASLVALGISTFIGLAATTAWALTLDTRPEVTKDFVSLVVAGRLAEEHPDRLYDVDAQLAVQRELDATTLPRPFANPPFVATAARLMTAGDLRAAFVGLGVVNLAAVATIAALAVRVGRRLGPLLRVQLAVGAFGSIAVASVLAEGAVSAIAAVGMALLLLGMLEPSDRRGVGRDGRSRADAAVAAGLVLASVKPHLAVVPVALLLARGRLRPLGRAVAVLALVALPSLVTPGLGTWLRYPGALVGVGGSDSDASKNSEFWWNVASLLHRVFSGSPALANALGWLVFLAVLVGGAVLHRRNPERFDVASLLVLGLVATPHANPHDTLWLPLAFALVRSEPSWPARAAGVRRALLAIAAVWPLLGLLAASYAPAGGSALAVLPMIAFALLCSLGRPAPVAAPVTGGEPAPAAGADGAIAPQLPAAPVRRAEPVEVAGTAEAARRAPEVEPVATPQR